MSHENHDLNPIPISTICSNQNAKTKPFGALHIALLMPKYGSRVSPGGNHVFKILAWVYVLKIPTITQCLKR